MKDPDLWGAYLQQSALLSSCLLLGSGLALAGVLLTFIEARNRQQRSWVTSVALGMPSRVFRRTTVVIFAVPTLVSTVAVALIGLIIGLELLAAGWGSEAVDELWLSIVRWSLVPAVAVTAFAAAVGFLLPLPKFNRAIIQDF